MLTTDTTFSFEDKLRREGFIRIRVYENNNLVVVIATDDDKGSSVTNAAEDIATQVMKAFNIERDKLVWVEHYPRQDTRVLKYSQGKGGEEYDLVSFTWNEGNRDFMVPQWKYSTQEEIEELVGEKI